MRKIEISKTCPATKQKLFQSINLKQLFILNWLGSERYAEKNRAMHACIDY